MTNIDMNPATATATATATTTAIDTTTGAGTGISILKAAPGAAAPHDKVSKKNKGTKKSKARRRAAQALAYFSLVFTGLLVLAEPWLLIPVLALVLAISLWD
ncbi:hypothetical protein ABZ845_29885 [Streptomyces sp. NPDC047022]|uniref:hypothetical protein n=1 Tax=Streptomyces sp. NPDC047022 TaxID=3155737 RepID=UPI0034018A0F